LEAVFDLVLRNAVRNNMDNNDLPDYLFIISDMQFDRACENTSAMKMIEKKFKDRGYDCPTVVFWNVANDYNNYPTVENRQGAILVSGFNTNLLDAIVKSPEDVTPRMFVDEVLNNPRYFVAIPSS